MGTFSLNDRIDQELPIGRHRLGLEGSAVSNIGPHRAFASTTTPVLDKETRKHLIQNSD